MLGFYKQSHILTLLAGTAIIVGAIYMLSAYKKMFFGVVTKDENRNLPDVNKRELIALIPLVLITIWLGIYPKPVLGTINSSVEAVVSLMHEKALSQEAKLRIPNISKDASSVKNSVEEAR